MAEQFEKVNYVPLRRVGELTPGDVLERIITPQGDEGIHTKRTRILVCGLEDVGGGRLYVDYLALDASIPRRIDASMPPAFFGIAQVDAPASASTRAEDIRSVLIGREFPVSLERVERYQPDEPGLYGDVIRALMLRSGVPSPQEAPSI